MVGYDDVQRTPLALLLEDLLHEASDQGLEVTLACASAIPPRERVAVEAEYVKRYHRAVQAVADIRGAPSFAGTQYDNNYPVWHRAPRLTTWADGNGIIYVALTESEGYPCLVGGARPHPYERDTVTLLPPGD